MWQTTHAGLGRALVSMQSEGPTHHAQGKALLTHALDPRRANPFALHYFESISYDCKGPSEATQEHCCHGSPGRMTHFHFFPNGRGPSFPDNPLRPIRNAPQPPHPRWTPLCPLISFAEIVNGIMGACTVRALGWAPPQWAPSGGCFCRQPAQTKTWAHQAPPCLTMVRHQDASTIVLQPAVNTI